jgi:thiamine-monophosphate kinase
MAAFLSLALPIGTLQNKTSRRFVDGFFDGLLALAKAAGTPLAGGDTASAPGPEVLADIVLLGSVPRGQELRRSGARVGDAIYVTGTLGGAAAELELLSKRPKRFTKATAGADHPHLFPAPRLVQGERLRRVASAAMDLSDGLSTDLRHLWEESGVGAVIDAEALPLHPLLSGMAFDEAERLALHGGEDYELLFTAPPQAKVPRSIAGVKITRIGSVTRGSKVVLRRGASETPLVPAGWEHRL